MKTNAVIRIVIWSIVLIALVGILAALIADELYLSDYTPTETTFPVPLETQVTVLPAQTPTHTETEGTAPSHEEPAVTAPPHEAPAITASAGIREIEITWVAGDIIIMETDVDAITVSESDVSDDRYALQYKVRDNELEILFCESRLMSGFGISLGAETHKDLYIEIPRNWAGQSIEIDAASANVEMHNITVKEMDVDGADGTLDFQNCHISDLDIDTADGDIYYLGTLDELDFDAASASFIGDLQNTPRRIDMDSMSGNLDIALPEDCGFALTMNGMSSRLSSDFEGMVMKNGSHVYGDGRCRINVDGMGCDVTLRKLDILIADPTGEIK